MKSVGPSKVEVKKSIDRVEWVVGVMCDRKIAAKEKVWRRWRSDGNGRVEDVQIFTRTDRIRNEYTGKTQVEPFGDKVRVDKEDGIARHEEKRTTREKLHGLQRTCRGLLCMMGNMEENAKAWRPPKGAAERRSCFSCCL